MAVYNVLFYDVDAKNMFANKVGDTKTYSGPATADGTAVITDNGSGADGLALSDDKFNETATADVTIGGSTSTGSNVEANKSWTIQDTVTGEIFQVVQFDVDDGSASGTYTLSEQPLVAGRVYETLEYNKDPNPADGDAVFTYADYVGPPDPPDGIVEGTSGNDTIDASYTGDPEGDVIDGDSNVGLFLDWSAVGSDEQDIDAGITQDTGGIQVDVSFTDDGNASEFSVESSDTVYVGAGEPFSTTSSLHLRGSGGVGDTSTTTIDFSAVSGSGFNNEVENVTFRVNDVDEGTFTDIVTIRAYDADGNLLDVDITVSGNDILTGDTVTAGGGTGDSQSSVDGSFIVSIAGPVASVEIDYDNGGTTTQYLWVSDIHFDAVPIDLNDDLVQAGDGADYVDAGLGDDTVYGEAGADTLLGNVGDDTLYGGIGDDTLDGGAGADTLSGDAGDDILTFGGGDTADGGTGDDTFVIDATQLDGTPITIVGGEGGETAGDTLDFGDQLVPGSIVYTNPDDAAGGKSGTATLLDGTVVNFSEIESIICFARGTRILTETREVAVEDLCEGDKVKTLDHGFQPIRWIGSRRVAAQKNLAPIMIRAGVLGNKRDLRVSPQHRMLISGAKAQLLFGEDEVLVAAKHLSGWDGVYVEEGGEVDYFHMLFDTHELIYAEGALSESFHPGDVGMDSMAKAARQEILTLFPELGDNLASYGPAARMSLKQYEARLLAS